MIKNEYQDLLEYSGGRLKVDLIKTTNSTSLLIWNPEYMIKFKNCEMLCGDGTFSRYPDIAPKKVTKHHQLYVIHAIWENTVTFIVFNTIIKYDLLFSLAQLWLNL